LDISSEILFFFSALGAFNGLLLSVYFLLIAKPRHPANLLLGGLLAVMSIRVGKSVVFHFYSDLSGVFLQFGLSACMFIGPFLYLYLHTVIRGRMSKYWPFHLGGLLLVVIALGIFRPFDDHLHLWLEWVIPGIYVFWLLHLLFAGILLWPSLHKLLVKKAKAGSVDVWMLSVYLGNVLVWAAYTFSYYVSYITGALTFTFLFYLLFLFLYFHKQKDFLLFRRSGKYGDRKIATEEATPLLTRLDGWMKKEHPYLDANLTLAQVADEMKIPPHRLSQLLNDNLGKNFPNYLNSFRVTAAQEKLKEGTNYTLEALGYDCGFNSKSTFYTAFKRHAGITPAQYQKRILERTDL
jgi:AraC-like DNA-binding protein